MSKRLLTQVFKIEKAIPIPPRLTKPESKYPFMTMKVGDSFLVPAGNESFNNVANAASEFGMKYKRKFSTRTLPDGNRRIWRTA
jgi:hypothetical protein